MIVKTYVLYIDNVNNANLEIYTQTNSVILLALIQIHILKDLCILLTEIRIEVLFQHP